MYREDTFKPPPLPYFLRTQVKQDDTQLVQIQEVAGLLGVALALVRQRLQQAATDLDPKLASEVVLVTKKLVSMVSARLDYALHLVAS